MSAAEKLGALESRLDELVTRAPQMHQRDFAVAALPLMMEASNALPQIVAVVEVLEAWNDYEPTEVVKDDFAYDRLVAAYKRDFAAALAALDEKLNGAA